MEDSQNQIVKQQKQLDEQLAQLEEQNNRIASFSKKEEELPIKKESEKIIKTFLLQVKESGDRCNYFWPLDSYVNDSSIFHVVDKYIPSKKNEDAAFIWLRDNKWINDFNHYSVLLNDQQKHIYIARPGPELKKFVKQIEKTTGEMMRANCSQKEYEQQEIDAINNLSF